MKNTSKQQLKTIMIVAGETSGDILASEVIQDLKKANPNLKIVGVGGEKSIAAGLKPVFPMKDLSIMGLLEVIPSIPKLIKRAKQLVEIAEQENIDLLLTIDAQDFNKRLARKIKAKLNIPCVHYGAPTVWAWRPKRAAEYAKIFDHLCCLFPFEPPYFTKHGLKATYVGHPVYTRLKSMMPKSVTYPKHPRLALLPGSRVGEVKRHWAIMVQTVEELEKQIPELEIIVVLPEKNKQFSEILNQNPLPKAPIIIGEDRFKSLQVCRAALAKSGTGNLELAMLGIPMIVGYKLNPLSYLLAKFFINVPYISPVNWVLGQKVVPEFIQKDFNSKALSQSLMSILTQKEDWKDAADNLEKTREKLKCSNPSIQVSKVILTLFS